jgi:hypothetical protein
MPQPCEINMDSGHKEWKFHLMVRTNGISSRETFIQVNSNSKRTHESANNACKVYTNKKEEYCKNEAEKSLDSGLKAHYVYAATVDAGQIYTDQIGYFPVVSSRGNKCIMILYEYDGNAIMTEPIKREHQENF